LPARLLDRKRQPSIARRLHKEAYDFGRGSLGLICFAVWRTTQAIYDPDRFSRGPSGILRRLIVYGGSAFIHFGLAAVAINVVFDSRSADEDREPRDWTAWLLSQPFGRTLTMVVGIGIVIGGLAFVFQAFKAEFRKSLMVDEDDKKWIVTLGRIGFVARGVVFVLVGSFLMIAGWFHDPRQATGIAGALKALQNNDFACHCWPPQRLDSSASASFNCGVVFRASFMP
jgi:hypothetical protein